ncbi:hypothetical protein HID58_083621 [Brassica napus]|uniref:Uncharacterized protein n=1 Tax=Brassica napus TaxID=3708 RepID=A0ABQ7YE02_BRANA|nr:hypothetical protein HID58_083621 [Brassica napus]
MLAVLEVVAISASRISPAGRDSGVVLRLSGASAWCLTSGRPGGVLGGLGRVIGGFGSAPLFHCYFPVLSAPLGSVWLHVMLESCSCLQGFMGVIVTDFSIPLFKELSMLLPSVACVRLDFRDRSSSGFFFAGNTLVWTGCCHLNPSFLLWELETEASPPPVVWSLLETEPPLRIWGLLIVGFRVLRVWCLAVSTVTPTMLERPWCGLSSFLGANSVCALPLPLRQPAPEKHGL